MTHSSRGKPAGPAPLLAAESGRNEGPTAGPHERPVAAPRQADLRTSIRPTVAEIDVHALRKNAKTLRNIVGSQVAIYGVVKADAYGHGAVAVARTLAPVCDALAVSLAEEGLELRAAGLTGPILVLGSYYGREHSDVIEAGLTPVVYDPGDLEHFANAPARRQIGAHTDLGRVRVHLKVDTGMSRLGVSHRDLDRALAIIKARPRLQLVGLCTHFASADASEAATTHAQLEAFEAIRERVQQAGLHPTVVHAANTAATLRFPESHYGAVRPGLALYGSLPAPGLGPYDFAPVLRLRTRVMALHEVATGAGVSYGHRFIAQRPSRIAVLPIGYADGYPRHLQGAQVLIRGQRVPIAGVVCMDMVMIDVTDVPQAGVGDDVILIGRDGTDHISVDEVASWAGTVNYEITCGLSKRVPRLYHETPSEPSGDDPAEQTESKGG